MRKQFIIIASILISSFSLMAMHMTNTYDRLWKKVEAFENESLPQSADSVVQIILKQALADKNSQQVIKGLIHTNKYKTEIDRDENLSLIDDLETYIKQLEKPADRSIAYSMLIQLYIHKYSSNSWAINNRTNIDGYTPKDINEWTSANFRNKVRDLIDLALQNADASKDVKTSDYSELVQMKDFSAEVSPRLYDFVMLRSIKQSVFFKLVDEQQKVDNERLHELLIPAKDFVTLNFDKEKGKFDNILSLYQSYEKDLLENKMWTPLILAELARYQAIKSKLTNNDSQKTTEAYIKLYHEYENYGASVEIINSFVSVPYWDANLKPEECEFAYKWLNIGIEKHPNYRNIGLLKSQLNNLTKPTIRFNYEQQYTSNDDIQLTIHHKNLQGLSEGKTLRLYRVENENNYVKIMNLTDQLESKYLFDYDTIHMSLNKLNYGEYLVAYTNSDSKASISQVVNNYQSAKFAISDLGSFHKNSIGHPSEVFVVNRVTGKPIKGASVTFVQTYYKTDAEERKMYSDTVEVKTNELGLATYSSDKQDKKDYELDNAISYTVKNGKDKFSSTIRAYGYSVDYSWEDYDNRKSHENNISIFTDRSLFRPGQKVYFKAIITDKDELVINNKKIKVALYSSQAYPSKLLDSLELTTNEFGSISGDFTLPKSSSTNAYFIQIENQQQYIHVEEYKRPTFEITFDDIDKTYKFGEQVTVTGKVKSFSGINLGDVKIAYNINRQQFKPFYYANPKFFSKGEVVTKEDGTFSITFIPEAGESNSPILRGWNTNNFNIEATATDINGESQEASFSIPVANVSMYISVAIPSKIEKSETEEINIQAFNLKGKEIATKGRYEIYKIDDDAKIDDKIKAENKVLESTFETGIQPELLKKLRTLKSGNYRIVVIAKDNSGKEVDDKSDFIIYTNSDARPPIKTNMWLVEKNKEFDEGNPAEIIFGTTNKDTYVLYQIYNNERVFERRFIKISDENKTFRIDYKPEYKEKVNVSFTYVYNKEMHQSTHNLHKVNKVDTKELQIAFDVFRDKLQTGKAESWTISIKDKDGKPASAEVLASMYDKSLDKLLQTNAWYLNRPREPYTDVYDVYYTTSDIHARPLQMRLTGPDTQQYTISQFTSDKVNWYGYISDYGVLHRPAMSGHLSSIATSDAPENLKEEKHTYPILEEVMDMPEGGAENAPMQIRTNFDETAFFYPHLKTNEKGETLISFTAPESNTSWQLRVLAHDKHSNTGMKEKTVVTQKELMVIPNLPRFVRQGDKTSISTKISNLSENAINGTIAIEFFNPETDKVIKLDIKDKEKKFDLKKDASSSVSWTFDVPVNIEVIGCRIVARSANFSDGEQHALAVLPNRILVTETLPFDITKEGTTLVEMKKLLNNNSSTRSNFRLTFEYTNSPAWYALMALPTLTTPSDKSSIDWFASYFANGLAGSIAIQYPKVGKMIQTWKESGKGEKEFASKLNQNEELKSILLEETPWVLNAKTEEEQMQNISLLFDLNNTEDKVQTAVNKLQELQVGEGGWSWYSGFNASHSITQYIMMGFVQMQQAGQIEHPSQVKGMQINALRYLDKELFNNFESLKKRDKWEQTNSISTSTLEYLYLRSFYRDIPINIETREAERFYTNVASKNWTTLDLYEKALLSVLAQKNGDKTLADKLTKSIRQHAKKDSKIGMYWPNLKKDAFLFSSSIGTHTFMMYALQANGASKQELDQMKQWLVKQKQVNAWGATQETIYTITALLNYSDEWFANGKSVQIKVGKETLETKDSQLGAGYIKQSWDASSITTDMGKASITTESTTPSYGAMYWQYYEDIDKIEKQVGDLNISKKLFRKSTTDKGIVLTPITENYPLKIGDKVTVRLSIKVDKDMQYIHIKDMRASCFEPTETISGVKWKDGLTYFQTTKDASTNMFIESLKKGTYILEYDVYVSRSGEYANGITSIQCLYAPEYASHTAGMTVRVDKQLE